MKWISVEDQLPPLEERVLVISDNEIYIAHMSKGSNNSLWWEISESGQSLAIVKGKPFGLKEYDIQDLERRYVYYWMPLPRIRK